MLKTETNKPRETSCKHEMINSQAQIALLDASRIVEITQIYETTRYELIIKIKFE